MSIFDDIIANIPDNSADNSVDKTTDSTDDKTPAAPPAVPADKNPGEKNMSKSFEYSDDFKGQFGERK